MGVVESIYIASTAAGATKSLDAVAAIPGVE